MKKKKLIDEFIKNPIVYRLPISKESTLSHLPIASDVANLGPNSDRHRIFGVNAQIMRQNKIPIAPQENGRKILFPQPRQVAQTASFGLCQKLTHYQLLNTSNQWRILSRFSLLFLLFST
jgi:hypothetical protein